MAVYWVTGASSGIGLSLVQELHRLGHKVIITARNSQKLSQIRDESTAKSHKSSTL